MKKIVAAVLAVTAFVGVAEARSTHPLLEKLKEMRGGAHQGASAPKTAPQPVTGTEVITLQSGGETRTYRLHIPAGLPSGAAPLVISIHGLNSNAAQQESISQFSSLADQNGFIAAYPEGVDAKWRFAGKSDADVNFIAGVIDDVAKRHAVDRKKVMVNGISNGAQMSWRMACDRADLFSVAGFVSGGYPNACPGKAHPPTIIFHGTADKVLPYDGRGGQMPVPEFAAAWAGCAKGSKGTPVDTSGEATSVQFSCGGANVIFYTIADKGHSWPGSSMPANVTTSEVNASKEMLKLLGN